MEQQVLLEEVKNRFEQYEQDVQMHALDFNIFQMAGIDEKEVIMCRVLYGLLCPNGTHAMGMEGLKWFQKDVLQLDDMDEEELHTAKVFREYVIPDSDKRMDLVIETAYRFLPIEVKINAEDQERQCLDYYIFAKEQMEKKAGNKLWKLYYLTLDGHMPSEKSTKNNTECCNFIEPVSWKTHMDQWLEHLIQQTKHQNVKETIHQYREAIRALSNQNEAGFQVKLNELLLRPGNMKTAQVIANGLKAAKTTFMEHLYYDIREEANKAYPKMYTEIYPWREQIAKYYNNQNFPGLTYQIHSFTLEHEEKTEEYALAMHFQIEWRSEMGFIIIRKSTEQGGKPFAYPEQRSAENRKVAELAESFLKTDSSRQRVRDGWWLDWFYVPTFEREPTEKIPDFYHCNDAYFALFEEPRKKEFVQSVMDGFQKLYHQVDWQKVTKKTPDIH